MKKIFSDAVSVFPERIRSSVTAAYKNAGAVYEIRLVRDSSVYFYTAEGIRFVEKEGRLNEEYTGSCLCPDGIELDEIIDRAAGYSGFLYDKQLEKGFITYGGGCRIGICTSGVSYNLSRGNINSLVIRLPHKDENIYSSELGRLLELCHRGLLIAGAPASGKTTLLRSISKSLSDAGSGEYKKVTVIDERGEISADSSLGVCTDIIKGKEKSTAILHALRLLSPQYIVCDEIGNVDETRAILEGLNSGVSFIASIHASDINELIMRQQFRLLFFENVFSSVAFLSSEQPGKITQIYTREEIYNEINRTCNNIRFDNSYKPLSYSIT